VQLEIHFVSRRQMHRLLITLNISCMSILPPPSTSTFMFQFQFILGTQKIILDIRIKTIYRKITNCPSPRRTARLRSVILCSLTPPKNSPDKSHPNSYDTHLLINNLTYTPRFPTWTFIFRCKN